MTREQLKEKAMAAGLMKRPPDPDAAAGIRAQSQVLDQFVRQLMRPKRPKGKA